jgi:hypothetical protein
MQTVMEKGGLLCGVTPAFYSRVKKFSMKHLGKVGKGFEDFQ